MKTDSSTHPPSMKLRWLSESYTACPSQTRLQNPTGPRKDWTTKCEAVHRARSVIVDAYSVPSGRGLSTILTDTGQSTPNNLRPVHSPVPAMVLAGVPYGGREHLSARSLPTQNLGLVILLSKRIKRSCVDERFFPTTLGSIT